jgi:SET domain-containing protein
MRLCSSGTVSCPATPSSRSHTQPNSYSKIIAAESEKKIVIFAMRDLGVGEEVTYDYKFPFEEEKIPCRCGAKNCRGRMN